MAQDKGGNAVGFGDYVIADVMVGEQSIRAVVRIVKLSETPKGVSAIGAFVDLVGNGRVAKSPVHLAASSLVMKSGGGAGGKYHEVGP